MAENLSNDIQALLNGAISNVATAITTTGSTGFPAVNFRVRVDDEIMLVTSVGGGTNWTVTRGIESTAAVAHNNSTPVVHVLTAGGLAQFVQERALSVPTRQTTVIGALSAGYANSLAAGSGLALNLSATASPLVVAFAAGFDTRGDIDFVSQLTADVTGVVAALPANNTSYINATYVDAGSVTWNKTLAPPQYGYTYDRTKQSVLQFAGAAGATTFLDDYGNTWTAVGSAKVQTNQFKFGTGGLGGGGASNALNGTTDYIKSTSFTSLGGGGWSMRAWVYMTALPASATNAAIICAGLSGGGGAAYLTCFNNAGTIRFGYYLSGDGSTFNIANGSQGTTLPVINTWYFVELTFDALAAVYRLYVNGTQESTVATTTRVCGFQNVMIGATNVVTPTNFLTGYIDKPEFLPYCQHPGGTTYTSPATAPDITAAGYSSDYFSIPQMKMFNVTSASGSAGTDPGMTAVNEVYVGEADTSGAAVTAVRNYAYQGKYESPSITPVLATLTSNNHNLGVIPKDVKTSLICQTTDQGWSPGEEIISEGVHTSNNTSNGILASCTRTVLATIVGATNITVLGKTTGSGVAITLAFWKYKTYVNRGW